jgi:nitrogen regulatory protein PII
METRKRTRKLPEKESTNGLTAPKKLKILITIVDRRKTDFYLDVLEGFEVNMQTVIYGHGTASNDMLHYLGLSQTDKAVIVSVVKEDKIKEITVAFEDKYFKTKNGKGIAFTIPITSLIGVSIYQFLSNSVEGRRGE